MSSVGSAENTPSSVSLYGQDFNGNNCKQAWRNGSTKLIKHPAQPLDHHNLFVAGLTHSCTNAHLMDLFAAFNPIKATVMMDVETGRSKRFAFVLFSSEDDGRAAVAALHGRMMMMPCGKTAWLHVNPSKYDGFAAARENEGVFVRNVPLAVGAEKLLAFYSRFGVVQSVEMRPGPNNCNLVALRFDSVAAARAAIDATHGKYPFNDDGCFLTPPLMAKFADPPRDSLTPSFGAGKTGGVSLSAMPTMPLFDLVSPRTGAQTPSENGSFMPSNGIVTPLQRSSTTTSLDEPLVASFPPLLHSGNLSNADRSPSLSDRHLTQTSASTPQPQRSRRMRYRNDPYSLQGLVVVDDVV